MNEKSDRAKREEKILSFWQEKNIFKKTLEKDAPKGEFVFYEGPPTANGRPGIHHLEARAFKDAIPRYKTMRGYHVRRKAGWDTHGLPVELEVEKQLGISSKKQIEEYGIAKFNEECKKNVWKYVDEWIDFTKRIGYWVDFDDAYITYKNPYIESVWNVIARADERGLLYKDYKVVPWCPRCGTALSSHELAQGYADVKDLSVYAKFKIVGFDNAYFLAWTTTPWTLPGNVALAVGADITYVEAKVGEDIFVLAKDRLSVLEESYEIIAEHKGSEMVGMEYEPLYPFLKENYKGEGLEKAYKVYTADFVNTEDGTGIVHTAVMYGQDDFALGTKIGLPKYHLVDESGHFLPEAGFLAGKFVKDEETAVEIIKDLAHRGLFFKKEKYEHSYPHCWRCKTPLIYYARDSWYIRMSELRDKLVSENEKINWEPNYIKEGRFGEWLREVKDWALSRERYWGTPLPVWESETSKKIVAGSIETLKKYTKRSDNKYFMMRHAEAMSNAKNVLDPQGDPNNHLTDKGRAEAVRTSEELKGKEIELILTSPFIRTKETAEIVRKELGLPKESVVVDDRLHEANEKDFKLVRKRLGEFIYWLDKKYLGRNILIVSHGNPLWVLERISDWKDSDNFEGDKMLATAEVRELNFAPMPHNEDYELDLHKPYIDEVVLEKDGEEYRRTKEVMDVWLDSGSMPFAQDHYPFSGKLMYPADFISEAIDQTRGWFYTLHAVGMIMERGHAYNNVICLGHILDAEGKKMSKSIGNVVNPWEAMDKYGVDVLRMWMYSVNQPGESKNFDERTVDELSKRVFNLLDNVYAFYEMYKLPNDSSEGDGEKVHILDRWILARLSELVDFSSEMLDQYKLLEPTRAMREFIDDLSTWYLRRSRDRLKEGDAGAKETLHQVLITLSKILAPFAPFTAEELYRNLREEDEPESVHLCAWPEVKRSLFSMFRKDDSSKIIEDMKEVRRITTLALSERQNAGIKVRQPLAKLEIKNWKLGKEYEEIIKDEVNVKEVLENPQLDTEVRLDTSITPELEEEGKMREVIRRIQDLRKEKNLNPGETMEYDLPEEERELFAKYREEIKKATNIELK